MDSHFIKHYFAQYQTLLKLDEQRLASLLKIKQVLCDVQQQGKKAIVVGNGGSAVIASHVSVDLSKNAGIRCTCFNEAGLITCLSNDYGYAHWLEKAIELYGDSGDVLIAISSSGQSDNILNACQAARHKGFTSIITLSGFSSDNPLRTIGNINLWVDSKAYNLVENIHQFWLLAVVDLIIGKSEYSSN